MGKIVAIDDEKDMLRLLERIVRGKTPHEITTFSDPSRALEEIKKRDFDVALVDLRMPQMGGLELLKEIKRHSPETEVIILTAYGTIETAVSAIKLGAYDFLTKPFKGQDIILTLNRAMKLQELKKENLRLKEELKGQMSSELVVGKNPIMHSLYKYAIQIAPSGASVIITGETGTGKELMARLIHLHSRRKGKFVAINCSAFPEQLMESEMFGHVKGAFSGAIRDKKGLVEEAHGGTLFLDEIGDLPLALQTKMLRFLQDGEFKPVGSNNIKRVDVRIIGATNKDIKEMVEEGKFRRDLYYRVGVINIAIPPLRERKEDIPLLAIYFLKKYASATGKEIRGLTREAMNILMNRQWLGNIRELENVIERATIVCEGDMLTPQDLNPLAESSNPLSHKDIFDLPLKEAKKEVLREFYHKYLSRILMLTKGNVSKAASMCEVKRQYLHRLMKMAGIEANNFRRMEKDTP